MDTAGRERESRAWGGKQYVQEGVSIVSPAYPVDVLRNGGDEIWGRAPFELLFRRGRELLGTVLGLAEGNE
jgi:hypothetical protein